jgi:hypothetical protein
MSKEQLRDALTKVDHNTKIVILRVLDVMDDQEKNFNHLLVSQEKRVKQKVDILTEGIRAVVELKEEFMRLNDQVQEMDPGGILDRFLKGDKQK